MRRIAFSFAVGLAVGLFTQAGGGFASERDEDVTFEFTEPTFISFSNTQWPSHIAAADLNGNGHADLIVGGRNNDGIVYIVPGLGDGAFGTPQPLVLKAQGDWIATGDFNGNGHIDLAFAIRSLNGRVALLFNNGSGMFDPEQAVYYHIGRQLHCVVAVDVNDNGHLDLITAGFTSNSIRILYNDGTGQFEAGEPIVLDQFVTGHISPNHIEVADMNGNGFPDLIVTTVGAGRINVLHNRGDGTFEFPQSHKPPPDEEIAVGVSNTAAADLNGNGYLDLVVPKITVSGFARFALYSNTGSGVLQPPMEFLSAIVATNWAVSVADLDGDGRPDLIFGLALPGQLSLVRNISENGKYEFQQPQTSNIGGFVRFILPIDLNGNGTVDLVYSDFTNHRIVIQKNLTPQGGQGIAGGGGEQQSSPATLKRESDDTSLHSSLDIRHAGINNGLDLARWLAEQGEEP